MERISLLELDFHGQNKTEASSQKGLMRDSVDASTDYWTEKKPPEQLSLQGSLMNEFIWFHEINFPLIDAQQNNDRDKYSRCK